MRIEKFLPEEISTIKIGLNPIAIDRLGSVVALFGKNGSGKSRILSLVPNYVANQNASSYLGEIITYLPSPYIKDLDHINSNYKKSQLLESELRLTLVNDKENTEYLAELTQQINKNRKLQPSENQILNRVNQLLKDNLYRFLNIINNESIVNLQKSTNLNNIFFNVHKENFLDINAAKVIKEETLGYLNAVKSMYIKDELISKAKNENFQESQIYKHFSTLQKLFKVFLEKDLKCEINENSEFNIDSSGAVGGLLGNLLLDNKIFNYDILSHGEKALLAFSMFLFINELSTEKDIGESIIIIDEPEIHLHPEAQIKLIDGLKEIIGEKGQLWIATHSLNILSHLKSDEIYLVKDNRITPPSRFTPGFCFDELIGIENHITELREFIISIDEWIFSNFIMECFTEPSVVKTAKQADPQVDVFKQSIESKSKINLLDFGAGKGRIAEVIADNFELKNKIVYNALEQDSDNKKLISKFNPNKLFSSFEELPPNEFDCALICNVLHEIPFYEWEKTLMAVISSLKPDGFLIIIEDKQLPKGEKPNDIGFLILDHPQLKILFGLANDPLLLLPKEVKYKDRILCSVIFKKDIADFKKDTILNTIKSLKDLTLKNINNLHNNDSSKQKNTRLSALYHQQYVNCDNALLHLKSNTK